MRGELGFDRLDGVAGDGRRPGVHDGERLFVPFHPREGQEIVNHPAEAFVFLGRQTQVFLGLRLIPDIAFEQGVHQHAHGGERGFEFVRDGGDEVFFISFSRICRPTARVAKPAAIRINKITSAPVQT